MALSLLEGVIQAVRAGVIVFDGEERIVLWNRWVEQHAQRNAAAVLGKTFGDVFPDMRDSRTHLAVREALRNNFASLLSQTLNKAPFPFYVNPSDAANEARMQQAVHVVPLDIPGAARHCLVQITDVSMAVLRERKLREQAVELQTQTVVDGLTGIANRRRFDRHLDDEFRRAKRSLAPISLIMIDVDSFKDYNDRYGHQLGDKCLMRIAATLEAQLHRSRDLVVRYGGEEFAVVLPDTDCDGALRLAETMRAQVEQLGIEHLASNVAACVTISLGLCTIVPEYASQAHSLIHAADRALYQAKRSGRNCVVVADDPTGTV
jgi:diguanylate cyclase (GGDEF)-like protein